MPSREGYVSVTPLQIDLTRHAALPGRGRAGWKASMADVRLAGIGMTSARTRDRLVQRLREQGIANLAGARSHSQRAAAHLRRRGARQPRVRGHGAAHRLRADDLAALHRRAHDRGAARRPAAVDKVLEVGTGCGYQTAVLAPLVGQALHHRAHRAARDARQGAHQGARASERALPARRRHVGWKAHAPFDGILVAAAPLTVPEALIEQLRVGGRLIVPVGPEGEQELIRFTRREQRVERESLGAGGLRAAAWAA